MPATTFLIRRMSRDKTAPAAYLTPHGYVYTVRVSAFCHCGSCCTGIRANALSYESPETAKEIAERMSGLTEGPGWRIEKWTRDDSELWREREAKRFADGTYRELPWENEPWHRDSEAAKNHYAHVSLKTDAAIAYTASEEHGIADRQTRTSPGKYLTRYFADKLTPNQIRDLAAAFCARYESENKLHLATSADDIEHVYRNGPDSCMSHPAGEYDSPFHPVRIYAGPDLAVAYMTRDERITARALVWPEKKLHGRVYGDEARFYPLLEAAGYEYGSLRGARMTLKRSNGDVICPYIDHHDLVHIKDKHLLIGDGPGAMDCNNTNGFAGPIGQYCPHCEESGDLDNFVYIEDQGESWCQSCYENSAFTCDGCGNAYSDNMGAHSTIRGETYCEDCAADMTRCERCDRYANADEIAGETVDGDAICEKCARHYEAAPCGKFFDTNPCACSDCEDARTADAEGREETPFDRKPPLAPPAVLEAEGQQVLPLDPAPEAPEPSVATVFDEIAAHFRQSTT